MNKFIYLACAPHSGSTLLAFLLGSHPQIATVGEVAGRTDYDGYRCSCGTLLLECFFWRTVASKMKEAGRPLDLKSFDIFIDQRKKNYGVWDNVNNYCFPLKLLNKLKDTVISLDRKKMNVTWEAIAKGIQLAEIITDVCGKEMFFDTTKDQYRVKYLSKILQEKFIIIFLARDGRGVVNSLMRKEKMSVKQAVDNWLWQHNYIKNTISSYCDEEQIIKVKYEDLCNDTESTLNIISKHLEVSGFKINQTLDPKNYHIIGNVMRKTFSGDILLDEKWRRQLSKQEVKFFDSVAGRENRSLGYL